MFFYERFERVFIAAGRVVVLLHHLVLDLAQMDCSPVVAVAAAAGADTQGIGPVAGTPGIVAGDVLFNKKNKPQKTCG